MDRDDLVLDLGMTPSEARRGNPASANTDNRPWPLQDLLDAADVDLGQLAELLHVDFTTVWRRLEWGLSDAESDQWAMACGIHPVRVWGWCWIEAALGRPEALSLFDA